MRLDDGMASELDAPRRRTGKLVAGGEPAALRSTAYVWVDDADKVAEAWRLAGANMRLPEDTAWGQHEGVVIDPDGNLIRFGSPMGPAVTTG